MPRSRSRFRLTLSHPNLMPFGASYEPSRFCSALNSDRIEFLNGDLEAALTFVRVALENLADMDKKARNQARARQVYDFVIERQKSLRVSNTDAMEISEKLKKLRLALTELGERF